MLGFAAWMMLFIARGGGTLENTDKLIPPGYIGNPWGPAANAARESGELPPIEMTEEMRRWERWGEGTLKTGDILFRQGDGRLLFGHYPFSRFLANITGSPYSHTGIAVVEDGRAYVYDTTKAGVRRQPFHVWVLDNKMGMGVKRVKPEHASKIPQMVAYLHDVYEKQVPFDYTLNPSDDALYCVEMTEKAFRSAGLKLSEPVPLYKAERFDEFPLNVMVLKIVASLLLDENLDDKTPIYMPGNERHGIWASKDLVTVYPPAAKVTADGTRPRTANPIAPAGMP
ncbi:MAG: YiiX/YebB-like N1pC/P60 family cysteine hydrolase [Isosphaeraceae bacterium]